MKKSIIYFYLILLIGTLSPSCKKDTETEPRELITSDIIWDKNDINAFYARQFLNSIYTFLPNGFNRVGGDFLDAATNDALPSRIGTSVENYLNGRISVIQNPDAYWGNSYAGIRQANILLANMDSVPAPSALEIARNKAYKAEARFIRAFLYFELSKRYGGVPLIADKIFTLTDNLELPRNTYEEVVNYIVSECDALKNDLIADAAVPDGELGRIPKGAAVALKCRILLYAASPLFNGGATAGSLKSRGITGYPTADPARWQKVIDAAAELDSLKYYALQSSFNNVFIVRKNTEIILARQNAQDFTLENNNAPVGFTPSGTQSGGRTSPTQNFIDAFPMRNGLSISDPASGYDPANPYAARDLRFGATVFYNKVTTSAGDSSRWLSRDVETYEGGKDKPNNAAIQTRTGYYLRKFLGAFSSSQTYSNVSHNFPYFRYAEIILNQAEGYNETGQVEKAVDQLKRLRQRAGTVAGTAARYGIKTGITQVEMRDMIRNERRIELAFEEHRFWDIRRWKIADQELSGPLFGMQITRLMATNNFTYNKVQVGTMVFSDKLYLMPIPYDETLKNSKLEQNPGW